ncbi:MAG TPA: nuclear transport factor 2 family protein [Bryobacteraceae bacterium]|nr:nuclear transport factor 2 family protein [Bryobacteraceae bacterium]
MKNFWLAFVLCAAFTLQGQNADVEKAEKAWIAAVIARDYQALDKIYDPGLIYAHSTGNVENKQQYMERLKGGAQKYDTITVESMKTLPHGNTVVTHSIARMTGTSNGAPFDNRVMMMHVWVKQGSNWKLLAHQTTRLTS